MFGLRYIPLMLVIALCSACAPVLAQGDMPVTSATPAPKTAPQNDEYAVRHRSLPTLYMQEAFSKNNAALLLHRADVRRELRITDKQNTAISPLLDNAFQGALNQDGLDQLMKILSPKQMQRLQELDSQWRGLFLLYNPDVAKQFAITDAQNMEFARIYTQLTTSIREEIGGLRKIAQVYDEKYPRQQGPIPSDAKARMQQEIAAEEGKVSQQITSDIVKAENQLLPLLTAPQKKQWKSLLGKPFVFKVRDTE